MTARVRLAVVADIHGNAPALEAVLADSRARGCDGVLAAGDLVGGVANDEVVCLLRQAGALAVRGNHEDYAEAMARNAGPAGWRTCRQWAALRWSHRHTERRTLDYLAGLPARLVVRPADAPPALALHGSPRGVSDGLYPDQDARRVDEALAQVDEAVLVCAHTHRPWVERRGERLALNPGSAGSSCNGDPRAWYGLLTWDGRRWDAQVHAVDYERARVRRLFAERGLLAEGGAFARALLCGVETGQPVAFRLVRHALRLAQDAGCADAPVLPDEVWEQAAETFDWE